MSEHERIQDILASLPKGWAAGPTHCPIGIDSSPLLCSAGYCLACQWLSAHWDEKPVIRLRKPANPPLSPLAGE